MSEKPTAPKSNGGTPSASDRIQSQPRAKCPLIGADSNIFCLLGMASRTLRENGMREQAQEILRKNPILRELWKDFCTQRYRTSFSWFRTSPEYYAALRAVNNKPISYGQRQAELYEAQLIWESQQKYIR